MSKIVQLIPSRFEAVPQENGDCWFRDGRYRILDLDGNVITVSSSQEEGEKREGKLSITADTEFSICDLEPEVIMPVSCTYKEFREHWSPEKEYDLYCSVENGMPQLYCINEYRADDQTFRPLEEGKLGWLYYNISFTSVRDRVRLTPIEVLPEKEYQEKEEEDGIAVWHREDGLVLLRYGKLERLASLQPDTRYYVMTAEGGLRLDRENLDGYFDGETVFRVIVEEDRAVCVICYQVSR